MLEWITPINHGLGSAAGINGSSAVGEQNFTKLFPKAVKGRSPHLQARGKCKSSVHLCHFFKDVSMQQRQHCGSLSLALPFFLLLHLVLPAHTRQSFWGSRCRRDGVRRVSNTLQSPCSVSLYGTPRAGTGSPELCFSSSDWSPRIGFSPHRPRKCR